jgi:LmbE family N-acetylglucosaminyl deacetylase
MSRVDVLAIGAHPDDVELGCGGTVTKLARAGHRVGILHLTCGEAGTRGTAGERRREAEAAAGILGATALEFLALGDGGLRTGPTEEDEVIAVLRRLRPELVLAPAPPTATRITDVPTGWCATPASTRVSADAAPVPPTGRQRSSPTCSTTRPSSRPSSST